jgi:hypothetical protein
MKLIALRAMKLGGKHVKQGESIDLNQEDAEKAIRHGWAVGSNSKKEKSKEADKSDEEVDKTAE